MRLGCWRTRPTHACYCIARPVTAWLSLLPSLAKSRVVLCCVVSCRAVSCCVQVQKGSVVVFLRFDSINQIVFDDAEPRSILISCRDERRYGCGRVCQLEECLLPKCEGVPLVKAWRLSACMWHKLCGGAMASTTSGSVIHACARRVWLSMRVLVIVLPLLLPRPSAGSSLCSRVPRTTWCSGLRVLTWPQNT